MNQSQAVFGEASERSAQKVRPYMLEWIQEFIKHSPFLVMASSDENGSCDASPKGGVPGFVKVLTDTSLLIPDVAGNRLFQTYENFETNPHVGLVFFIPGLNSTARVNGSIRVIRKGDADFDQLTLEVFNPDEKAKVLQAIVLEVKESYSHCPRSTAFSKVWDTDTINKNIESPPIDRWAPGI